LGRDVLRHAELDGVAARGADHRVGDAGIAGCRVEHRASRAEQALPLAVENHGGRSAGLHGASGVLRLSFGVQLDAAVSALEASQPEQRGVADEIEDGPRPGNIRGPGDRKRHFSYPTYWVLTLRRSGRPAPNRPVPFVPGTSAETQMPTM